VTTVRTRIALPHWYASLPFDRSPDQPRAMGATRIGALDVWALDAGADVSTFGPPGDASVALFDGYLFDRDDLCVELRLARASSDARIAAAAFQAWGSGCFERLAGCYLVAIWDGATRVLRVAHDALGRHPVFYAATRAGVWFGSNVLRLAASGAVPARPNRLSLALTALTLWPEGGDTFFEGIHRVRPGHYLEVREGDVREVKYWQALPSSSDEWLGEREVLEQFEPKLLTAVGRCMQMEPGGLMLSGGVDSVTIGALATEYGRLHGGRRLVALSGRSDVPAGRTVQFPMEEEMQSRAAEALGMRHVVSRTSEWTGGVDDVTSSLEVSPDLPGPSRIYWVGTYMAFYRLAVSHGLDVMLTGSGGDNWLAVSDTHAADLIRRGRLGELKRFVAAAAGTGGARYRRAMKRLVWHGGLKPLLDTATARVLPHTKARFHRRRAEQLMPEWLCPDPALRTEVLDHWLARRVPSLTADGRVPKNYYQHSLESATNAYLFYEFETVFHIDAMCGIQLLSPYHDQDLVAFFSRIPPPVLVRGNRYKGLLRPVVEKYLPGRGFDTQRKDYPRSSQNLTQDNLRRDVERAWPHFTFDTLAGLGVVDRPMAQRDATRIPVHDHGALVRLFALMSAERWLSRWAA
jgi:asparagine synthetase B (glutamine-hydrolysing)